MKHIILSQTTNTLHLERSVISLWSVMPVISHFLASWGNERVPTLHSCCWAFKKGVITFKKIQMLFSPLTNLAKIKP